MTSLTDTYIHNALLELGLTAKEALVYNACLNRGSLEVNPLMKVTGLSRSTVYFVTDELIKKGFLRLTPKGKHRLYIAEHPETLRAWVIDRRQDLDRAHAAVSSLLPTLTERFKQHSHQPNISFHPGQEAIRMLFKKMLDADAKEILFLGELSTIEEVVGPTFLKQWAQKRISKELAVRGIRSKQKNVPHPSYLPGKKNLITVRYIDHLPFPMFTFLFKDKVIFVSSARESFGILVESKDLYTTLHSWFQLTWASLKTKKM